VFFKIHWALVIIVVLVIILTVLYFP